MEGQNLIPESAGACCFAASAPLFRCEGGGKPRAVLVPVRDRARLDTEDDPAFGLWRDHADAEDVDCYVDRARRRRA